MRGCLNNPKDRNCTHFFSLQGLFMIKEVLDESLPVVLVM